MKYSILCQSCNEPLIVEGKPSEKIKVSCDTCQYQNTVELLEKNIEEVDFYAVEEPFSYISIIKDLESLDKQYRVLEPVLTPEEWEAYEFIKGHIIDRLKVRLDGLESDAGDLIKEQTEEIVKDYGIKTSEKTMINLLYYLRQHFLGFGRIDPLMNDSHIEDISCDGATIPLFVFQRDHGSLATTIVFQDEDNLSRFVVKLAQMCGKHISVADPMLDATMPDGSRIQMTLSSEVTTKGSTFTIRKFRADPITPVDLIEYNTFSSKILAYLWLAVEHGYNALIAGGTASGKTSALNAMGLFIPRESKIVSIEETREINLPHPNWIPGITRSGFGEVVNNKLVGEIDLFDLMKAALRQRPEYILVGEIRGKEAYVLFQAMATGHTTYSTVHADSVKALIHRMEGKPINIPRSMLQSLDVVLIQSNVKREGMNARRCRQVVELLNVDVETKEVLTNTVFFWQPADDTFSYAGKSYILEELRTQLDLSRQEMLEELEKRAEILEWMHTFNIREFKNVAQIIMTYAETPDQLLENIRTKPEETANIILEKQITEEECQKEVLKENEEDTTVTIESNHSTGLVSVKQMFSKIKRKKKTDIAKEAKK